MLRVSLRFHPRKVSARFRKQIQTSAPMSSTAKNFVSLSVLDLSIAGKIIIGTKAVHSEFKYGVFLEQLVVLIPLAPVFISEGLSALTLWI